MINSNVLIQNGKRINNRGMHNLALIKQHAQHYTTRINTKTMSVNYGIFVEMNRRLDQWRTEELF